MRRLDVARIIDTFNAADESTRADGLAWYDNARRKCEAWALSFKRDVETVAGVWAASTGKRDILEPGDIEEALQAAAAIGDDTLQRKARDTVQPESWTHGSSAQRVRWFRRGFDSGDPARCDTFAADEL